VVTNFSVEFTDQAAADLGGITKTVAQRILKGSLVVGQLWVVDAGRSGR